MGHLAVEFPRDVARGCRAMIERRDIVVQLASGFEEADQRWQHARRSWDAALGIRSEDDLAKVVALFEEVRGRVHSFAFRDWLDYKSGAPSANPAPTDQVIGTGDGLTTSFQIVKRYGTVNAYTRPIALPDPATLRVAVSGGETTAFSMTPIGGVITFDTPPALGEPITAGYTFSVPVRFDTSELSVEWVYFAEGRQGIGQAPAIPLIEVRQDGDLI